MLVFTQVGAYNLFLNDVSVEYYYYFLDSGQITINNEDEFYQLYSLIKSRIDSTIFSRMQDSKYLIINYGINFNYGDNYIAINPSGEFTYNPFIKAKMIVNDNIEFEASLSITNDGSNITGFSAIEEKNARFSFVSGEYQSAILRLKNNNMGFELGRDVISIGRMEYTNLLGGFYTPSFNGFKSYISFNNFKFIHDLRFIENIKYENENINRYITYHAIEFSNENLYLNVTEVVVYGGIDRPVDLSYLNPLTSYIEVEHNNRMNYPRKPNSSNWYLNISGDIYSSSKLSRNTFNLLLDDIQIDKKRRSYIPDLFGFQYRFSKFFNTVLGQKLIAYIQYSSLSTYLYTHENGYCNFVGRGYPLGNLLGNDYTQLNVGVKLYEHNIIKIDYFHINEGANDLVESIYRERKLDKTEFPSYPNTIYDKLRITLIGNTRSINYKIWIEGGRDAISAGVTFYLSKLNIIKWG